MTTANLWSNNSLIANTAPDGHEPALAASGTRLDAVWSNNKTLYHATLTDGVWSAAVRMASGEQPTLLAAPDGTLHCLFVNWFLDACQVYYVFWNGATWSLPEAVSRTPGLSTHPTLTLGPEGALHAAWEDTTPGYATIYYGTRQAVAWTASPVSNGRGSFPALGIARGGEIFLAWQDRLTATSKFEIFCAINNGTWSTPENVSGSANTHSIYPRLAISETGAAHLVWQEEQEGLFVIRHADRRASNWSQPSTVSTPGVDCRLARLAINRQGYCQVVWAEGAQLQHRALPSMPDAACGTPDAISGVCEGISDLATCIAQTDQLHALWSGYSGADTRQLYYLQRQPIFKHAVFLPNIQR